MRPGAATRAGYRRRSAGKPANPKGVVSRVHGRWPHALRALLAALAIAGGCTPAPVARDGRVAQRDEPDPGATHRDAEALAGCEAALAEAIPLTPAASFLVIARGCGPLFKEPACRAAWLGAEAHPVQRRLATIAKSCAASYCPALSAPPPLCARPDILALDPSDLAPLWAALYQRILRVELGAQGAQRLSARHRAWAKARMWVPPDNVPECHADCCGASLRWPGADGFIECCLCD